MDDTNNETLWAVLKGLTIWILTVIGNMTLSKWVLLATLIWTVLQSYVLVRDKIINRKS